MYRKRIGTSDAAMIIAEEHSYGMASEHDGSRAFHVVELGPFNVRLASQPGDLGGTLWVMDSEALAQLEEEHEVITGHGCDPDECDPE